MAKMKVPDDVTGVTYDGVNYEPDKNGIVEVPEIAFEALKSFGLTVVPAKKAKTSDKD